MTRRWIATGSLLALLAVIAGTFAAHILEDRLTPHLLKVFDTGIRYHMFHALAIIATALAAQHTNPRLANAAATLFLIGIALFSGSLYLLALTDTRWLGMITPLGGLSFLAAWATLTTAALKK